MQIQIAIITFHSIEVMRFLSGIYMSDLAVNLYAENMPKFYFALWYIFGNKAGYEGNQLPVSADRWQHCSQIGFAAFI